MQWRDLGVADDLPRLWHTATAFNDGEVIVFGGCHGDILSHDVTPVCLCLESSASVIYLRPFYTPWHDEMQRFVLPCQPVWNDL